MKLDTMRKLNLGCGFDHREGFVNADSFEACAPDVLMDMEVHPWPFEDNSFDYVLLKHVLEHVGATFDGFKAVMRDIYRITAPGGIVDIQVPHFRHDTLLGRPRSCAGVRLHDVRHDVESQERRLDRPPRQRHDAGPCPGR